ncbi:EamA family transporter [Sneathiella sp. DP05]|uniref:EamA family transporter n=1 Tax=Sneathiella litorea TaxID=2606216 RepID=A0A6L8W2K5_9PROT|nr:DMT family transporter [Sneathiella litorea]MZR29151.1 EamA family transporter [Sneathiella litorea]
MLAVILLGLSFVGIRAIMADEEAAASLGFLRYGIATLMLLPLLWRRRIVMPPLKIFIIVALLGMLQFGLFHLFVNTALKEIPASRGAVIFALIPIMTMLIAAMAGRDSLNGIKLFAATLSIVGVFLAIGEKAFSSNNAPSSWMGEILFFMAVCCGATYNAFSGRLMQHRSVLLLTIIGMSAGTIVIFPVAYSEGLGSVIKGYDTQDWLWILYLAGPAAAFSLFLFNWGLQQLSPSQAAIYVPIAPIMAAAFGALILDEHLSSLFLAGLACAVAGPIIVNWRRR